MLWTQVLAPLWPLCAPCLPAQHVARASAVRAAALALLDGESGPAAPSNGEGPCWRQQEPRLGRLCSVVTGPRQHQQEGPSQPDTGRALPTGGHSCHLILSDVPQQSQDVSPRTPLPLLSMIQMIGQPLRTHLPRSPRRRRTWGSLQRALGAFLQCVSLGRAARARCPGRGHQDPAARGCALYFVRSPKAHRPFPPRQGLPALASHWPPPGAPKVPTARPLTLGSASPGTGTEKLLCTLVGLFGKWE